MADNRQYSSGANATANVNSNANLTREISDMSSCLVLDGLPIVPNQAGASKLREVLLRILNEKKCSPKSLDIVVGDTGASLGFAFLEYSNRKAADDALIALNNLPIDKVHRLRTNAWIDFDTYLSNSALRNRQSEFSAAHETKLATFKNPYAWLNDANAREQYLIKSGNTYDVEIFWSDPHMLAKREPILGPNEGAIATAPQEWTECDRARGRVQREYPCWSPLGTYIVSVNTKGIRTWVDSDSSGSWKCFLRFDHLAVLKFDFSPCEKYLVTGCRKQCILWDARLGKFITSFPIGADDKSWPIFRWKFDDSMFTQVLPTMLLMFNAKNLSTWTIPYPAKPEVTFSWSPASHHIAYSTISKERCLKVVLEEVLSATDRRDLAVRTIHNVDAVRIVWCPNGKFCLCVINIRGMRPDKVEVFSILNGKEASVDQIDIEGIVLDVSWDSSGLYGNRFCVLNTVKKTEEAFNAVTFYEIDGEELRTLHTLPKRQALQASWSPCGTHLVLIESSGSLEFVTISPEGKVQSLQIVEQPRYHSSFWDPSGRYFITSSTMQLTSELDLGFVMFNFLGQRVCTHAQISKFSHFLWRPRPASLLSQDDITDLLGTLDKRVQAYEREDEERRAKDAEVARVHNEEVRQRYYTTIQAIRESFKAKTKDREKRVARLHTQTPMFHLVKKVREEIVSYV